MTADAHPHAAAAAGFDFLDPGPLADGDLELVLVQREPANELHGLVPVYHFELRAHAAADGPDGAPQPAGHVRFRVGSTPHLERYAGHFGYGVHEPFRGRHYAERAVRLLLPLARRHGFTALWITCNPDNWPSRRTCERLGGALVEVVAVPPENPMYAAGAREKCRYRIDLPD